MSIIQVAPPGSTPQDVADYQAQNNLTDSRLSNEIFPIGSGVILKGSKFIIQGSTFIATSDTAITGAESLYVKFVVVGNEATPEYIANLTGVTWSDVYNGYYNTLSEYVFFDEMKAYISGLITTPRLLYNSIMSEVTDQILKKVSNVEFGNLLAKAINGDSLDVTGTVLSSSLETGDIDCDRINTGEGYTEVYPMDQPVRTTDDLVLNSLDTGHGANDLYPMDQPVTKNTDIEFNTLELDDGLASVVVGKLKAVGWNILETQGDVYTRIINQLGLIDGIPITTLGYASGTSTDFGVSYISRVGTTITIYDQTGTAIESYTSGSGTSVGFRCRIIAYFQA